MPSVSSKDPHGKTLKSILKKIKSITKCPEDFLSVQQLKSGDIRTLLKDVYDFTILKDTQNKNNNEILPELTLEDLDEEQVWQLIELRNNVVWPQFLESTSKLLSLQEEKLKIRYAHSETSEKEDDNGDEHENETVSIGEDRESDYSHNDDEELESEEDYETNVAPKIKGRPSIVDDKFFKLSEMEAFLTAEDEKELNKQKGKPVQDDFSINYFDDNMDDDEEENIGYKDFFADDIEDEPRKLKSKIKNDVSEHSEEHDEQEEDDIPEVENDNEYLDEDLPKNSVADNSDDDSEAYNETEKPKSSFEERQERLNQRINDYEQEILGEKPWQLKGEIHAGNRPQNSLLEEILEFEATTRPAPIITEETTLRLEDIIRQRIKDRAWDDVELKVKPINTPKEFRKQLVLDQEKSKESLAQIYEKQYQKEIETLNPDAADASEEEPKSHKEIKEMMLSLFVKLDALSNFHFTPKPVVPEPKIITNTPAVNMEEVAPVGVSNAKLLAPEEIRKRAKGDILGSNERSKTDKNRDRRHKKLKQRAVYKALEERDIQKQKLGIQLSKKEEQAKITKNLTKNRNVEKVTISNDAGSMKSSKAFFSKLQETTSIQNKNSKKSKKTEAVSAKKFKL